MFHKALLILATWLCVLVASLTIADPAAGAVTLSGTVTDSSGAPLEGAAVGVRRSVGGFQRFVRTDALGRWSMERDDGTEFLAFAEHPGFLSQLWNSIDCGNVQDGCSFLDGDLLVVPLDGARDGIDFALSPGASLAGTVRSDATDEPIESAQIELFEFVDERRVTSTRSAADGSWAFDTLAPGAYVVIVRPGDEDQFEPEVWDDVPCGSFCQPLSGTPIELASEESRGGIDFRVTRLGKVSGRVLTPNGSPIAFATVFLFDANGEPRYQVDSDATGSWRLSGVEAGSYSVLAADVSPLYGVLWPDVPCQVPGSPVFGYLGCDLEEGQKITVGNETMTDGIDLRLFRGGTIEGSVVGDGNRPLARGFLQVVVYDDESREFQTVMNAGADVIGEYRFEGLADSPYLVLAKNLGTFDPDVPEYSEELFDDVVCQELTCSVAEATPVQVASGEVRSGVDFRLERPTARIEGTVSVAGPESEAGVVLYSQSGQRVESVRFLAGDGGTYRFLTVPRMPLVAVARAVPDGEAIAWPDIALPNDWFERLPESLAGATVFEPAAGEVLTNIDFEVRGAPTVEGGIFDAQTREPLVKRVVGVDPATGDFVARGVVNPNAFYVMRLSANEPVQAVVDGLAGYGDMAWPRIRCFADDLLGLSCESEPEIFALDFGEARQAVNFPLEPAATVGVTMTSDAALELTGRTLVLYGTDLQPLATDLNPGSPAISGVYPGTYWIVASADGHHDRVVGGESCKPRCDFTPESAVVVNGTDPIPLAVTLEACGDSCALDGPLIVQDNRFEVTASYRRPTPGGGPSTGEGVAVPLTDDSGYFWFFRDTNVELVVKVLDACQPGFDRFWVFAAGLTDVEVDLEVRDTLTGETKTYRNELGQPFQPILDTDAFATCSAGAAAPVSKAAEETLVLPLPDAFFVDRLGLHRETAGGEKAGDCTPGAEALCLQDQRFRVEIAWETADDSGVGQAQALTTDTGYFWFFRDTNIEVVVKVLDACQGASERFWVFAAGLTDVRATLRVVDTATGDVRDYENALGEPFQPILDTDAFATCGAGETATEAAGG